MLARPFLSARSTRHGSDARGKLTLSKLPFLKLNSSGAVALKSCLAMASMARPLRRNYSINRAPLAKTTHTAGTTPHTHVRTGTGTRTTIRKTKKRPRNLLSLGGCYCRTRPLTGRDTEGADDNGHECSTRGVGKRKYDRGTARTLAAGSVARQSLTTAGRKADSAAPPGTTHRITRQR